MPFFCLPAAPADFAEGFGELLVCALPPSGGQAWPTLKVEPLGWSWAFYLVQRVASRRAQVALGAGPSVLLADHGPIPDISEGGPAVLAYCDNFGVGSTARETADSLQAKIATRLVTGGFKVHEVTVGPTSAVASAGRSTGAPARFS